ncbi:MAG: AAA family ATPase [Atopobiaceae bacterium]|nr:AAA family ATPase [Atopobiaceae bacterium]
MIRRSTNPFTPTFGSMPYALAGRTELIDDVIGGLANRPGDPNRSTIFIGPRGSGKTVLLRTIAEEASAQGWVCVSVSARKGLLDKLVKKARSNARHLLDEPPKSEITSVQLGPVALGREPHREDVSWWLDLQLLVEDLNAQDIGLLVTIDELDPACEELIDFIDTYQHLVTEGRDVALLMAGLPSKVSTLLLDESVSFIRRAFQRRLDPINRYEVEEALFATITGNDKQIDQEALSFAAEATQGFAFAIQLVGYYLWRFGYGDDVITVDDAHAAVNYAKKEILNAIVEPSLRELTQRELEYLEAMALDDGPLSTSVVAQRMGISMTNASNLRRRLIDRGLIAEVSYGVVDFVMPVMRDYLRR